MHGPCRVQYALNHRAILVVDPRAEVDVGKLPMQDIEVPAETFIHVVQQFFEVAGGRGGYVVDAEDKIVGRLATKIASVLRGKHKPSFTPHVDTGDYVNAVASMLRSWKT